MNTKTRGEGLEEDSADLIASNPVYRAPPADFSSEWVYFYYLKPHGDPNEVRVYRLERSTKIPYDNIEPEIDTMFREVSNNVHLVKGTSFREVPWLHIGYLVFVYENAAEKIEDITFRMRPGNGNHTFRGGKLLATVDGRQDVSGFYCVNRMRHQQGRTLREDETEVFRVRVNHPHLSVDDIANFFGHEDSGTNMGPPIGGG
jgi:hypothetical protein